MSVKAETTNSKTQSKKLWWRLQDAYWAWRRGQLTGWYVLENVRKRAACRDHPNGAITIKYHPASKSYLLYCNERALPGRRFGSSNCVHHEHYDPSDW